MVRFSHLQSCLNNYQDVVTLHESKAGHMCPDPRCLREKDRMMMMIL